MLLRCSRLGQYAFNVLKRYLFQTRVCRYIMERGRQLDFSVQMIFHIRNPDLDIKSGPNDSPRLNSVI